MTKAEKKAFIIMMWGAFKRGLLMKPTPTVAELSAEFWALVKKYEEKL